MEDGWEIPEEGEGGQTRSSMPGLESPLQWNKGISSLEGEVRINPNSWCWDLSVTVRNGGRKYRSLTSHGGFSFYLWPRLAVHGFPTPLPSSPRRPSSLSSPFWGLSVWARQFHSGDTQMVKQYGTSQNHSKHLYSTWAEEASTMHCSLSKFVLVGLFYSADLELTGKTPAVLCKHFLNTSSPYKAEQG